jgi:hypothetical protein
MITREQVEALQQDAAEAGDFLMEAYCRITLSENGWDCFARHFCEEAIANGRG